MGAAAAPPHHLTNAVPLGLLALDRGPLPRKLRRGRTLIESQLAGRVGIAIAAGAAGQWVILAAAAAIGVWLAGLAVRALRP